MGERDKRLAETRDRIAQFECLASARLETERAKHDLCARILDTLGPSRCDELDAVAFGSMARGEMHTQSDLDWLLVAHGTVEDPMLIRQHMEAVNDAADRGGWERPGATGVFGALVAAQDMVNTIGLNADTNLSHTRRILLLQESVALFEPERHEKLLKAVTLRYLFDRHSSETSVPRFLVNDIVRYWRTVCVDYQAKRWADFGSGKKWASRLLKLRSTRKVSYVGAVVSTFVPQLLNLQREQQLDELVGQWELPSLDRIAQLASLGVKEALVDRVLSTANKLLDLLFTNNFFVSSEIAHPKLEDSSTPMGEAYVRTGELNSALTDLLHCPQLAPLTEKYLLL